VRGGDGAPLKRCSYSARSSSAFHGREKIIASPTAIPYPAERQPRVASSNP